MTTISQFLSLDRSFYRRRVRRWKLRIWRRLRRRFGRAWSQWGSYRFPVPWLDQLEQSHLQSSLRRKTGQRWRKEWQRKRFFVVRWWDSRSSRDGQVSCNWRCRWWVIWRCSRYLLRWDCSHYRTSCQHSCFFIRARLWPKRSFPFYPQRLTCNPSSIAARTSWSPLAARSVRISWRLPSLI